MTDSIYERIKANLAGALPPPWTLVFQEVRGKGNIPVAIQRKGETVIEFDTSDVQALKKHAVYLQTSRLTIEILMNAVDLLTGEDGVKREWILNHAMKAAMRKHGIQPTQPGKNLDAMSDNTR